MLRGKHKNSNLQILQDNYKSAIAFLNRFNTANFLGVLYRPPLGFQRPQEDVIAHFQKH